MIGGLIVNQLSPNNQPTNPPTDRPTDRPTNKPNQPTKTTDTRLFPDALAAHKLLRDAHGIAVQELAEERSQRRSIGER